MVSAGFVAILIMRNLIACPKRNIFQGSQFMAVDLPPDLVEVEEEETNDDYLPVLVEKLVNNDDAVGKMLNE